MFELLLLIGLFILISGLGMGTYMHLLTKAYKELQHVLSNISTDPVQASHYMDLYLEVVRKHKTPIRYLRAVSKDLKKIYSLK